MIKKSFEHLDIHSYGVKAIFRPTLEYSNSIWGPHFVLDQQKIEKVQHRATKMIPQLQDVSYEERLSVLSLPSLSHQRFKGDLIMLYKILNGYFNSDFSNLYTFSTTFTRGHHLKLFKYRSRLLCRSNYFFNKIINDWNQLPATNVNSNSLNCFKSLLDNYLINCRFFLYSVCTRFIFV